MSQFPTTQWTIIIEVIQKGGDDAALAALGDLFVRYRPAIKSFFERYDRDHAEDLTQAFFESRVVIPWNRRHGILSPLYSGDDIRHLPSFASILREPDSPEAAYLWGRLPNLTHQQLRDYTENDKQTEALRELLVNNLNHIIQGPSLFEEGKFPDVPLSLETRNLRCRATDGNWRIWVNRSLLGDAFPGILIKGAGFLYAAERKEESKFRSFLSNAMRWFLMDHWKGRRAIKAGRDVQIGSLEAWIEKGGGIATAEGNPCGRELDQAFALQMLNLASSRLKHSAQLEAHLRGLISQRQAAEELGLSENAFRQAYWRFRERLAESFRTEVSKLVGSDKKEIEAEMKYLMSLLAK